jgi:hypothetical protein
MVTSIVAGSAGRARTGPKESAAGDASSAEVHRRTSENAVRAGIEFLLQGDPASRTSGREKYRRQNWATDQGLNLRRERHLPRDGS